MHLDTTIQLAFTFAKIPATMQANIVFMSIKNIQKLQRDPKYPKRSKEHLVLIEAAFLNPRKIASGIQNIFAGW